MKIHLQDESGSVNLIRSHDRGEVVIGETRFAASLAVSPDKLISEWTLAAGHELSSADIGVLLELEPELVLIGTGETQHFPAGECLRPLIDHRVGYEIMTTAAACRTYNVLVAEGRAVVAGLILPA